MAIKTEWVTDTFGHVYEGESLYKGKTKFQTMEIFKSDTFGTLLFLDGKIQISEADENRYHQYLVSAPLLAHPNPRSVLVVGGGDCFSIEEAVKFPSLKRILMVELDDGVVDFCKAHYPAIKACLQDPRIEIVYENAREYLAREAESFDVIVVDLTEPHGPSKMLYTYEFYQLCTQRLNEGGMLSLHTDNYFLFPDSFATIRKTLGAVFKHISTARVDMPCFGMGWTYRLASDVPIDLKRMAKNLSVMQKKRKGQLDHLTPSLYTGKPTGEEQKVLLNHGRVSTDRAPYDKFEKLAKKVTK